MALNNPAFSRDAAFSSRGGIAVANQVSNQQLNDMYNREAVPASGDVMTVEDTIAKTVGAFAILVVGAALSWMLVPALPLLWLGAGLIGFVLALVNIFKKKPSGALVLTYAAFEGVFVGGISRVFENASGGVVTQAVIATIAVVGVTLALFASGKIRASKKATKIFMIALIGYVVFTLLNVVLMATGVVQSAQGLRDVTFMGIPLGAIIGVLVVIMAAYSLVLDFDNIQKGVANRAPRAYGWKGAFGIMVTVIWLYLELLRFFSIIRN
ncbi:Bax inhibitor-1/YccA family protein [Salinibacterium sp. UTAS2018]|uniref:Bax inhibitor-1/YccA family protein n=1 Tax=unclassified Salinibacterium TaxID=2632331 RepID=UPI0010094E00|nr:MULTISPECIES: Bax inhibitor-1/YccA family protein [unclassified Salinibacterium]MBH0008522.1 Bax inhibitor-1/YccA family protein [Salinibacterium sp. SWN1162]QAV70186.1 Bax inhibitor-1/YccA family protein [Salinibacterium sp. UTAS2018]